MRRALLAVLLVWPFLVPPVLSTSVRATPVQATPVQATSDRAASSETLRAAVAEGPAPSTRGRAPVPSSSGTWALPLPAPLVVARPFVAPDGPYGRGHRGVDLRGYPGTAVLSPGTGVVHFAGPVAGRGVVSVDIGSLRFTYEPLQPRVRGGQRVSARTVLGVLAGTHPGCGACLHWGLRRGAVYLDPLRPIRRRVRLLPPSP